MARPFAVRGRAPARALLATAVTAITLLVPGAQAASEPPPPAVRSTLASTQARDLRATFRAALCARIPDDCAEALRRFPGEGAARAHPASSAARTRWRIAFVPGLFADCVEPWLVPFSDAAEVLRDKGYDVRLLRVQGRAGTAENATLLAREIAQEIARQPADGRPFMVFAYSKGLPDVLDLLVHHPAARARIGAVVGYAGAAGGSALADEDRELYGRFIEKLPLGHCAKGSGAELDALRRPVRRAWWKQHGADLAATKVPFYTLVGTPAPDRVSPVLRSSHEDLARLDPHNDSQLLWQDALMPGGALLGFVNADHWSIAMPVSRELPALGLLFRDRSVPRAALVEAAIEVVDAQRKR